MKQLQFKNIDINDPFFDSLKESYKEFSVWFQKKANENAFITYENNSSKINGFLYLKLEEEKMDDIKPAQIKKKRLKVGTFKINSRGTKYGERFIKKIMDTAISEDVDEIYLTIFNKHDSLICLIKKYGFERRAIKSTINGDEDVYFKDLRIFKNDVLLDYPIFKTKNNRKFCLSIYPKYHTRLFPDSILNTEKYDVIKDVSHTNSIPKIYVCSMYNVNKLLPGDIIVTYRTNDGDGPAHYRSVVTSICIVESIKTRENFKNFEVFFQYANTYSIFDRNDLYRMWQRSDKPLTIIKMTYNVALTKRITKQILMDELSVNPRYWGFFELSDEQFKGILEKGQVYENIIIN